MSITENEVRSVLNEIIDPCSANAGAPAGLVDMGLISGIQVDDDGAGGVRVAATVGVTEPTCVLIGSFAQEVRIRLGALPGVSAVDVSLDESADWTPERLSPDYRRRLEEQRSHNRRRLALVAVRQGRGEQ
ncbi:metal-sulfur cluster assembly factor [Streptomyces sp. NPDC001843]|uniref:metal-sulfur cluster assembly factor n=1 Tax=Streptomyces sp. NPDC001843 TaxID=3364617 RepID=UPI0036CAC8D7